MAVGHACLAVAAATLVVLGLRAAVGAGGLPLLPLGPQLVAWSLVLVVRLDAVQRLLGGRAGLAGRQGVRQVVGCLLLTGGLLSCGLAVLVPAGCLLVTSVHAQWDARPTSRPGMLAGVGLTAATQALVLGGVVDSTVGAGPGAVLAGCLLALTLATSTNFVVLAQQRQRADAALLHAADHDALTGALGRRGLQRRLTSTHQGVGRAGTAAVVLDLDGFKPVNDRYGHAVGDAVLVAVVGRFRAALPADALLSRTGGDEFVAVVPGVPSEEAALDVARRLEECLSAPLAVLGREVSVGVSAGAAWTPAGEPVADLLGAADASMYAAKRARRSREEPLPARPVAPDGSAVDEDPGAGVPRQGPALERR